MILRTINQNKYYQISDNQYLFINNQFCKKKYKKLNNGSVNFQLFDLVKKI